MTAMPPKPHRYVCDLTWTGAGQGSATNTASFSRAFEARFGDKIIAGSADPNFQGDATRLNPEELLVSAVASCHMLTWLYLAARNQIGVVSYHDQAEATLAWIGNTFAITAMTLRPQITLVAGADAAKAAALHEDAHQQCFIARSVNFPIAVEPVFA